MEQGNKQKPSEYHWSRYVVDAIWVLRTKM